MMGDSDSYPKDRLEARIKMTVVGEQIRSMTVLKR